MRSHLGTPTKQLGTGKEVKSTHATQAAALNSSRPEGEREEAFKQLKLKNLEFLFLAPEQFNNENDARLRRITRLFG